jgi:DNA-directed RNA polymerase beta' subunit
MLGIDDNMSGPERHGFVTSSYGRGLDEAGLFYQATAARSTVVSTGVNTADPGYLQRQLSKFMADVYVDDKMNVVNHEGVVIKL